jgi:hypothetical protein
MKLVKTNENNELLQYPFSLAELRKEFPSVSFPSAPTSEDLAPFDCFIVREAPPPASLSKLTHDLVAHVIFSNEEWVESWNLEPVSEEEAARRAEVHVKGLDYKGFWKAFIRSNSYSALKAAAGVDLAANVLATELISVFSDAKTGNLDQEAMQAGVSEALAALQGIDPALVTETEELLTAHGLDVYLST